MTSGPCPCGSGAALDACCGPVLAGEAIPATAEALMRSRYTAYTRGDVAHLARTWHPRTRPARIEAVSGARWLGLTVRRTEAGAERDANGVVEFVARYKIAGRAHRIHETSSFEREGGRWYYVDGIVR